MVVVLFFFKQKTAYEMRISDWSSDVCSSDLARDGTGFERTVGKQGNAGRRQADRRIERIHGMAHRHRCVGAVLRFGIDTFPVMPAPDIGRASCREIVFHYV